MPRYAVATHDHHPEPRTEPEFRAQRLGFALSSLAAELVTERRKVMQLKKELEQLKARLASRDMSSLAVEDSRQRGEARQVSST